MACDIFYVICQPYWHHPRRVEAVDVILHELVVTVPVGGVGSVRVVATLLARVCLNVDVFLYLDYILPISWNTYGNNY